VKVSSNSIYDRSRKIPSVNFAPQENLTSFGGAVIFQALFVRLGLWARLDKVFSHLSGSGRLYRHGIALRCLLVHVMLGFKFLRERDSYGADPMVLRLCGLKRSPSVPTLSRLLGEMDATAVANVRQLSTDLVLQRLSSENLGTVTLDFDGSVQSTKRHAEGTAVGFNKEKKGRRSYYPLFCTVAQSGQALDHLHRSGNVHDSNGAIDFIIRCIAQVLEAMPHVKIEVRLDSAFFSDAVVDALEQLGVQYTISVPFERFAHLKKEISSRRQWQQIDGLSTRVEYFEKRWKPKCWRHKRRFLIVRQEEKVQGKGPIQLDLFEPIEREWKYKVIITNKIDAAEAVLEYHEGRGYQEKILGEMKQDVQMAYIPCRKRCANEIWLASATLAHNLGRELQMGVQKKNRAKQNGVVRWKFAELSTLRRNLIQRAGKLVRPAGKLTVVMGDFAALREGIRKFLPKVA
jgi:hypothetical protein